MTAAFDTCTWWREITPLYPKNSHHTAFQKVEGKPSATKSNILEQVQTSASTHGASQEELSEINWAIQGLISTLLDYQCT